MYARDAWSSEAVIFMLLSVPFYSLKRDILKLLRTLPHFYISEHLPTCLNRRETTSRMRAAEIRSDVVLLLVQPSLLICKVGCFWSFCHQPNNLFNSLPVFDSAMQIDSGGSAEGMIKSPG